MTRYQPTDAELYECINAPEASVAHARTQRAIATDPELARRAAGWEAVAGAVRQVRDARAAEAARTVQSVMERIAAGTVPLPAPQASRPMRRNVRRGVAWAAAGLGVVAAAALFALAGGSPWPANTVESGSPAEHAADPAQGPPPRPEAVAYPSLAVAVAEATPGGTVQLPGGTAQEPLRLTKPLTLIAPPGEVVRLGSS